MIRRFTLAGTDQSLAKLLHAISRFAFTILWIHQLSVYDTSNSWDDNPLLFWT